MATQTRVGWRAYTPSSVSTLLTSLYGVWNGDTLGTSLDTSVYNAWNMEFSGSTLANSLDSGAYLALNGDLISSTVADDAIGSSNATLINGATTGTGNISTALIFDGVNDYAELPANTMDSVTSEFTMSMWINTPNFGNGRGSFMFSEQTRTTNNNVSNEYDRGISLMINAGNSIIFSSNNNTDFTITATNLSTSGVAANTWFLLTVSYKQGVGAYIYINGKLNASTTTANALTRTSTTIARLGMSYSYTNGSTVKTGYYGGKIEGFTVWNRKLTDTEINTLYNSSVGITYPFSNKTLYGPYDLVNSIHGTTNGYLPVTTGISNKALSFPLSNSYYAALPDNSLNSLISGDFSVSFWVNHTQSGVNTSVPFCYMSNPSTNVYNGFEIILSGAVPQFKIYPNAALASVVQLNSATSISANNWHHIVVTRKSGTRSIIYVNGVQTSSNTSTSNPTVSGTFLATIGKERYAAVSQYSFANGTKMDGITTWTKELTADEVTQLYNIGGGIQYPFTTQTIKTPYSVYNGDNLVDPIGAKNATINGGVTYTTGKIGNAYTFNGTNASLSLPVGAMSFQGTSFSFSMWLKFNGTPTNYATILSNCLMGTYKGFIFGNNGGNLYFQLGNGTSTWIQLVGPSVSNFTNTWGHVTVVWEQGVGGKMYMNGVLVSSVTNTTTPDFSTITANPVVGVGNGGSGWPYLNGSIDGLTFWNSALRLPEISTLYNDGNGMEYPYSSSIVAKLPSASDVYGTNNGTLMNGCTFTTGKIGKAFTFDGVNDSIRLPAGSMNFTDDFSISAWVSLPGFYVGGSDIEIIWNTSVNGWFSNPKGFSLSLIGNVVYFSLFNGTSTYNQLSWNDGTGGTLKANSGWIHIVATRKKSTASKIYVNGVLKASNTNVNDAVYIPTYQVPSIGNMYSLSSTGTVVNNDTWAINGTKIDGLSTWTKELSATEVTELYNSGNGKQYPNF